ncbi:MAG: B12-binding domain-containing radical SAM protein, partial [Anaerolineaceae bacterium]|nr:B12-binding domain-containing radical SAM protein [Anaerolineaceae bacterium]
MQPAVVIQEKLERILLRVQKPGRYVGGELNQIVKLWNQVKTHVALVFPDIYDLGISNLGLAILYDTLNKRDDVLAERAYSPWVDMEEIMRDHHIPLFSLESKHPLSQFDILGISLPYENLYTNALNILDLAEIPLFSSERGTFHPLVIAGGHSAFNPEPMADFIDAFVIGEGEEVIHEIVNIHQKNKNEKSSRKQLLLDLSKIWGVYVPSLYETSHNPDGTIQSIKNKYPDIPATITKRIVAKL